MRENIVGVVHVGCLVEDRDAMLRFIADVFGVEKSKSHNVYTEENSRIMGIPDSDLNIGFAKQQNDDIFLEAIEYRNKSYAPIPNDVHTPASSMLSYRVPSVAKVLGRCKREDVRILQPEGTIKAGPFAGCKNAVLRYRDLINFEVIEKEGEAPATPRLCKICYLVSALDRQIDFYKRLDIVPVSKYELHFAGQGPFEGVALQSETSDFVVELFENTQGGVTAQEICSGTLGLAHVCYHTDALWPFYERMNAAGVPFIDEPMELPRGLNKGAKAVYMLAPDDIRVELYEGRILGMDD